MTMARDQEVCSSGSEYEGGMSPTSTVVCCTRESALPITSCSSPSYQIMSLSDMIEQDKDDCPMSSGEADVLREMETSDSQELGVGLSSCGMDDSEEISSFMEATYGDIASSSVQHSSPPAYITSALSFDKETYSSAEFPSACSEKPGKSSMTMDSPGKSLGKNFYLNYQPKEFTLNETINTPCYEAALSEQINCRNQSRMSQFSKRIKRLKEQFNNEPKAEGNYGNCKTGYKNISLPDLKQIYFNARAKLHNRRQGNIPTVNRLQNADHFLKHLQADEKSAENVLLNKSAHASGSDKSDIEIEDHCGSVPSNQNMFEKAVSPSSSSAASPFSATSDQVSGSVPLTPPSSIDLVSESGHLSDRVSDSEPHYSLKMKSIGSKSNPEMKKYRYNQTALALQQSGLMKTTMKTAELLRKSQLLQQELAKLKKETAAFVTSVLNNPENKHLKDMYSTLLLKNKAESQLYEF